MINIQSMFQKVFGALVAKIASEPVFVSGLGVIALTAFNEATAQGLGTEDALLFATQGVLTLLARQLVWPSVKVDAATGAALPPPEPPLDAPFLGDTEPSN